MRLINVKNNPDAIEVLYDLLAERPAENFISHERMPTRLEHARFVTSEPFRFWYLIETAVPLLRNGKPVDCIVGALEATLDNEIGVAIFKKYHGMGFATAAIGNFMRSHKPLPPIPAIRNGRWLANIATRNEKSKSFFKTLGFRPIQETWELR